VLAVLASGCRFAFDDVTTRSDATMRDGALPDLPDGLFGHDEDGDGIPDTIDLCPHVASTANGDSDGDGVGDVCDPEPTNNRQSWVLFESMTSATSLTMGAGGWTLNTDDYSFFDQTDPAQLLYTGTIQDIDAWIGFDIDTLGTGGLQAAIITNGMMVPYWYGELYDGGSGARISISEFDGTNYNARSTTPVAATFPVGPNELYLSARVGGTYTLRSGALSTSFGTPAFTQQKYIIFGFGNLSGRVRYIAIIKSQ